MFSNVEGLLEYVRLNAENRECEFKTGVSWKSLKLKIVKGVLALANLQGGGFIIIGVSENKKTKLHKPVGMTKKISQTYDQDTVSQFVNEYAEPHVDLKLAQFSYNRKHFVVIDVSEFKNEPIICKKDSNETTRGRTYCRTHRKVESSPDPSVSEMREIIELAVDKGIQKQMQRIKSYGFQDVSVLFDKRDDF